MDIDINYYIAVIDPRNDFYNNIEYGLKQLLEEYIVQGFNSPDEYIDSLKLNQDQIPLILIADYAARWPNVQKGVFYKTRQIIPRTLCLAYTTDPNRPEWEQLQELGILRTDSDVIDRIGNENLIKLAANIKDKFCKFMNSEEYKHIELINNYLKNEKELSNEIGNLLIEAARGTNLGNILFFKEPTLRSLLNLNMIINNPSKIPNIPKMNMENTKMVIIETLSKPKSLFARLIERKKINFLQKAILEDMIRFKLYRLSLHNPHFLKMLSSLKIPVDTDGWRILNMVIKDLL